MFLKEGYRIGYPSRSLCFSAAFGCWVYEVELGGRRLAPVIQVVVCLLGGVLLHRRRIQVRRQALYLGMVLQLWWLLLPRFKALHLLGDRIQQRLRCFWVMGIVPHRLLTLARFTSSPSISWA